jgi:hypothetical protein
MKLSHRFVTSIPDVLEDGVVYVSIEFATAIHKCCCGCGEEVVTPFSPTDWKLIFDGKTISLDPSIGNWNFPCQSHYWIRRNKVVWARRWSRQEIEAGRAHDRIAKARYNGKSAVEDDRPAAESGAGRSEKKIGGR